jgi:hypothetical protein
MAGAIKENGDKTTWKELESTGGKMEEFTQESIWMTRSTAMEFINGKTTDNTQDTGQMESNTDSESILSSRKTESKMGSGRMARGLSGLTMIAKTKSTNLSLIILNSTKALKPLNRYYPPTVASKSLIISNQGHLRSTLKLPTNKKNSRKQCKV